MLKCLTLAIEDTNFEDHIKMKLLRNLSMHLVYIKEKASLEQKKQFLTEGL